MRILSYLITFVFLYISLAFTFESNNDLLLKKWRVAKLVMGEEVSEEPEDTDKSLEFLKDNTFIVDGKVDEKGTWAWGEDKKFIKIKDKDSDVERSLEVVKLTESEFVFSLAEGQMKMTAYLIAAK